MSCEIQTLTFQGKYFPQIRFLQNSRLSSICHPEEFVVGWFLQALHVTGGILLAKLWCANSSRTLTICSEKEKRVVDSRAPFYCVDFFLYLQALEVVEFSFVGLELSEESVIAGPPYLAARVDLLRPTARMRLVRC